jgi:tRNA (cmo5U34)-methyltransferase
MSEKGHASAAAKFDSGRADDYAVQSRTALAGYDACHEVTACLLSASLGRDACARILVVGVGGSGQEIIVGSRLEPGWTFVGVDPSAPMLEKARTAVAAAGFSDRAELVLGTISDLPHGVAFDAAILIGVLHHLPGEQAKRDILREIAERLNPGAPFVIAGNRGAYAGAPLFLAAWGERWRMYGEREGAISARLGKILEGADPPASDAHVAELLASAGFSDPKLFFSSLFWGAWIAARVGSGASGDAEECERRLQASPATHGQVRT